MHTDCTPATLLRCTHACTDVHMTRAHARTQQVRVVRARELPVMDLYGHCDTYVRVWVRPRVRHRTPTVPNTAGEDGARPPEAPWLAGYGAAYSPGRMCEGAP